jgi:hypothetical protein
VAFVVSVEKRRGRKAELERKWEKESTKLPNSDVQEKNDKYVNLNIQNLTS